MSNPVDFEFTGGVRRKPQALRACTGFLYPEDYQMTELEKSYRRPHHLVLRKLPLAELDRFSRGYRLWSARDSLIEVINQLMKKNIGGVLVRSNHGCQIAKDLVTGNTDWLAFVPYYERENDHGVLSHLIEWFDINGITIILTESSIVIELNFDRTDGQLLTNPISLDNCSMVDLTSN